MRYDNCVALADLQSGRQLAHRPVLREPIGAALSADGETLAVANFLPAGAANEPVVRAAVSLLGSKDLGTKGNVWLPNGSGSLRGLAFHPVRNLCAAVHNVARFQIPATQVEYGWMNVSAVSLICAEAGELIATVLLDEPRRGAANPWAVAWSPDGKRLCIAHAGTDELSVIDGPAMWEKLSGVPAGSFVTDFGFLKGIRRRIELPGKGPRAVVIEGEVAWVAEFFSDSIAVVDLNAGSVVDRIPLQRAQLIGLRREGERLFNDASIGHQGWQSCASCHPDGRMDGLNWDLLNDGIGNPKNTKSLLFSHKTPPAMSVGVRDSAEQAVRSGLRHILFAKRPESEARALDEYLQSLTPVASPHLVDGKLSRAALRGKRLFHSRKAGCSSCHPGPLYTDCKAYDVGTGQRGKPTRCLDTPTLLECWRTGPYLHDGSAATIRDVLTTRNLNDKHGKTSGLSERELADLAAFLLSL